MNTLGKILLSAAALVGAIGCAETAADSNCQLGADTDVDKLVGTCCEPVNAAGAAMLNSAGQPLQGVCNAANLCQYGKQSNQVARGEACGEPTGGGNGNGTQDMGPSIIIPDTGISGGGGNGGGGNSGNGGTPAGGAGGDGGNGGPGGAGGNGEGGNVGPGGNSGDPCADVRCPAGAECNPATGRCVPVGGAGVHTGACETADDCPPGDECVNEADSMGRVPGGFCLLNCRSDNDCGDGLRCLASGQNNICFAECNGAGDCRDGWTCIDLPDGSGGVCQPDCRTAGCGAGEVCNGESGLCEIGCPYACAAGEECTAGHCVRLNGTCATDYHCPVDTHFCHEGQCVPNQGTDCTGNPQACAASQQCFDNAPNGSLCIFGCQGDDECPFNESCLAGINVCWFTFCGDPAQPNGDVFGQCALGSQQQWAGTCFPLPVGDPAGGGPPGICLEAGNLQEGQACNAQAEGRDVGSRNEQCAPGLLCFGDPDDALDPARNFAATGECSQLCDPGVGRCGGGRVCVDFSSPDDPNTADNNESRTLGICLNVECTMGTGGQSGCGAGEQCRPFTLVADQGACSPAGNVAAGGPCRTSEDCADEAFCGDPGGGPVCLPTCNEGSPNCAEGTMCVNNGWGFGICL